VKTLLRWLYNATSLVLILSPFLKLHSLVRLVDGLNIDLDHVKALFGSRKNSKRVPPRHWAERFVQGSARVRDDWSTPTERSSGLIPLNHQTTMETPPGRGRRRGGPTERFQPHSVGPSLFTTGETCPGLSESHSQCGSSCYSD